MSKGKTLFEDEHDENTGISLNSDYAKKYESWRRKEELNKSKARYGDIADIDNESSSSSSDNDDDFEEAVLDTNFLQTLSCLKSNNPRIYDKNVKFFNDDDNRVGSSKPNSKTEKPMYLRDYERKLIVENGGQVEESDDEDIDNNPRANSPTYVEQQKQLKESLKQVLQNDESGNEEDENWGGMFKKKDKSKEQEQQEEADYIQWLKGQKESLPDGKVENELKPLKEYWHDPELDSKEKFLRDYILNKKFLESNDANYIPSYDEIVHDSDDGLSEDGEAIREQEEFETKYNYRFEEPDKEFIKRYPRTMENSMRKKDDKRKQKRVEIRERKEQEKLQKKEELQRIKALKRKEIEEKIEKLKEITGNCDVGFNDEDIDGDFDPEEHDRRMQQLFNEEFYGEEEGDQKPEFPDLDHELEIENWDKWNGNDPNNSEKEPHCEDDDFNMDCDYDPTVAHQTEMLENSKGKKKRKRKSKFAEVVSEKKPIFDPNNKTYEQYLDEYYKLDCEDIIGDIPCRFKYRKVVPNDFGLSVEEILAAKDKELNRWCSLKKAVQIRPDHVEKYEIIAYKKKGENEQLKRKIFHSLYSSENTDENQKPSCSTSHFTEIKSEESSANLDKEHQITEMKEPVENGNVNITKKGKKRKLSDISVNESTVSENNEVNVKKHKKQNRDESSGNNELQKQKNTKKMKNKKTAAGNALNIDNNGNRKVKNKYKKHKSNQMGIGISDERLKAYGINPKKYKNKLKYGDKK